MRDATPTATAFHAVALAAAARTALRVAQGVTERRAGRDPSGQEPAADVRADLAALTTEMSGLAVRAQLQSLVGRGGTDAAALAQAFEAQLTVDALAHGLRRAHQKLLSLYPAVPEALVEASRQLAGEAAGLEDVSGPSLAALALRVRNWVDATREALA